MTKEQYETALSALGGDWREELARARELQTYDGVNVDETPDEVTVRITGAALANVREMQSILNRLLGTEDTAADFVWYEMLSAGGWDYLGSKWCPRFAQSVPGIIVSEFEGEERETMVKAFKDAGFSIC